MARYTAPPKQEEKKDRRIVTTLVTSCIVTSTEAVLLEEDRVNIKRALEKTVRDFLNTNTNIRVRGELVQVDAK